MRSSAFRIIRTVMALVILGGVLMAASACSSADAELPARCQSFHTQQMIDSTYKANMVGWVVLLRRDSTLAQVNFHREQMKAGMARLDSIGSSKIESARIIDSIAGCFL